MSNNSNIQDDELDPRELLAVLWSHKILITLLTGLSIFLAGYYALTAERKFSAKAIFQIEQTDSSSSFNLTKELGNLASIAGFSNLGEVSSAEILIERATGREFIISLQNKLSLDQDPYFNSYVEGFEYKDPFWKATIKKIIGWQKTELEKKAIIEFNVLKNFRKSVLFNITEKSILPTLQYTVLYAMMGHHNGVGI